MLAAHFSRFFAAEPERLHFCAHSHHPWPDATEAAHARYWSDSNRLADRKWSEMVFAEIVPRAQEHIARLLSLSDPRQVAFAPNTHEFVTRLYSCLSGPGPHRVLASAHEFHSFRRQTRRFVEAGFVELHEVPGPPWDTFARRFVETMRAGRWDLVWLSHVFFDSAFHVEALADIVESAPQDALVVIDGYHAFCSLPVDLPAVHRRAFYMGGGYKYAMAGEGACFLCVPPGCALRPIDTGWFATFSRLAAHQASEVPYSDDGFRFWGATFDPTGLYRFNAAMDWLASTGKTIADVHRHAREMQALFLDGLARLHLDALALGHLVPPAGVPRGNFLVFDVDGAEEMHRRIAEAGVAIDRRDRRLRFGFGVYHDPRQVERLLGALGGALR